MSTPQPAALATQPPARGRQLVAHVGGGGGDGARRRGPPRAVLEEDEYVAGLAAVIERDYFPDMAALRAQHACVAIAGAKRPTRTYTRAPRACDVRLGMAADSRGAFRFPFFLKFIF